MRLFAALIVAVARALFRIRVEGVEHLPPEGRAIVVANHVSALDGVILGAAIWWKRRRVARFVTAAEFFRNPVFGAALRAFAMIPIHRGERDTGAIAGAIDAAAGGDIVGIFPEGRVNPDPGGRVQDGRTGAARIALASDAPIVPAAIWGTQDRWPRSGLRWSRPLRPIVAVTFGPAVALEGDGSYDDARNGTGVVMRAIEAEVASAKALAER